MAWLAVMVLALFSGGSRAAAYSTLYAFGDSLSDSGSNPSAVLSIFKLLGANCDPVHPCPPYFNGRYSNGPVTVERLADAILPGGGTPANFQDFAVAGATSGIGNYGDGGSATQAGIYGLPGLYQQLGLYLTSASGVADPNALYFLWGGANEILTQDDPLLAADRMAGHVAALASSGARHFLLPNLPDLGLTPYLQGLGPAGVAAGHAFSTGFNAQYAAQLQALNALFPAVDFISYDVFSLFNEVIAHPGDYGFTNTGEACLVGFQACANPADHLFFDDFHPTSATSAVLASALARAVPEPGTAALLLLGGLALLASRRQRQPTRSAQRAAR